MGPNLRHWLSGAGLRCRYRGGHGKQVIRILPVIRSEPSCAVGLPVAETTPSGYGACNIRTLHRPRSAHPRRPHRKRGNLPITLFSVTLLTVMRPFLAISLIWLLVPWPISVKYLSSLIKFLHHIHRHRIIFILKCHARSLLQSPEGCHPRRRGTSL